MNKPVTVTESRTDTGTESGLTAALAAGLGACRFEALPADVVSLAKHCMLDWLGVTLAGAQEPLTRIALDMAREQGGHAQATVIGHGDRLAAQQAALVNGTASHALDYDDVHLKIIGHPSVPVLPALLALAEQRHASGQRVIAAFVAGFETECRVGSAMGRSHYNRGWHATATVGSFGAAAACADLLGLDAERSAHALGIAATQAAGLKSMFGTMCKPLHAGKAAANGLLAADLAARGFTSRTDAIECEQGFGPTQSENFDPARARRAPGAFDIRDNLFKYHAACYLTHSTIEAARALHAEDGLRPEAVAAVTVRVQPGHLRVCNIPDPETGLETKFSLRHTCALGLSGIDTAALETYSDAMARDPALIALRERVRVETDREMGETAAVVTVETQDGRRLERSADVGVPMRDLDAQWQRLTAKFHSLVSPLLGAARTEELVARIARLEESADVAALLHDLKIG